MKSAEVTWRPIREFMSTQARPLDFYDFNDLRASTYRSCELTSTSAPSLDRIAPTLPDQGHDYALGAWGCVRVQCHQLVTRQPDIT